MGKAIKTIKWVVGWKDKGSKLPDPISAEERAEKMQKMRDSQMITSNPKRGEPIEATCYPLSPVARPKPIKKLPGYLKKVKYRKGWVN